MTETDAPLPDPTAPVAVAQGALPRMRELERLLASAGIEARVLAPPGAGANA